MRDMLKAVLFVIFFATTLSAQELTGTLLQIKKTGIIKIGYRQDQPPMSYLGKDGIPVGYSIDICKFIVTGIEKKIHGDVKVEYVPVTAADRFDALSHNKIDLLCGSTSKTLSRSELVDFTLPTFVTGATFMILKSSQIMNNFAGKRIGVVKGTTMVDSVRELFKETGVVADIVMLNATSEGVKALEEGKIDAFAQEQAVLIGQALKAPNPENFSILPNLFTYESFALAVRRNDADFRLVADRVIAHLCQTKEIVSIYKKWFGEFSSSMPTAFQALIQINAIPE
ncbi:MAG TPA: amino acid ABC transporter substrate-binding protein [Thermodesulfovibrionales bacterium]|nr:amino acid ABC transporter substrate-binding protein [Thermodesulfovibrionales bacterium]